MFNPLCLALFVFGMLCLSPSLPGHYFAFGVGSRAGSCFQRSSAWGRLGANRDCPDFQHFVFLALQEREQLLPDAARRPTKILVTRHQSSKYTSKKISRNGHLYCNHNSCLMSTIGTSKHRDVYCGECGCCVHRTHDAITKGAKSSQEFGSVCSQGNIISHHPGAPCLCPQYEQHATAQSHP